MPESPILSDHLDVDHDDAPLRLRSVDSIVGQATKQNMLLLQ
jgi:hypothetical protein